MSFGIAALMLFACNTIGQRVSLLIVASVMLCFGGLLLHYSRKGKVKEFKFSGALLKGEEAKLSSTIFAVILILLGALCILSQILYLDC